MLHVYRQHHKASSVVTLIYNFVSSGERLGVWLALFPTVYLSAGTATALILIGGETMKLFFQIVCGPLCSSNPLSTVEWYLVFTSLCIVLSQLPNLNSIAGLSLIGAITAIFYSTMVWVLSVSQPRPPSISYEPLKSPSFSASVFSVLNALGIIAFAFRGHNLALEIQVWFDHLWCIFVCSSSCKWFENFHRMQGMMCKSIIHIMWWCPLIVHNLICCIDWSLIVVAGGMANNLTLPQSLALRHLSKL